MPSTLVARRSRSPAKRFPRGEAPKLKTWVLCRTNVRLGVARSNIAPWKDAIPALVSKVTQSDSLQGSETKINVVVPNVLALQYNFTAPTFKELRDLKLSEVRPYQGRDHQQLKEALLRAVREKAQRQLVQCKEEAPKAVVSDVGEQAPSTDAPQPPLEASAQQFREEEEEAAQQAPPEDETLQGLAAVPVPAWPAEAAEEEAPEEMASEMQDEAQLDDAIVQVEAAAPEALDEAPEEASPKVQGEAGSDDALVEDEAAAPDAMDEAFCAEARPPITPLAPQRVLERRETPPKLDAPVPKQQLLNLTAAIAKAFVGSDGVLTRQELEASEAVASFNASEKEFEQVLSQLEGMNKVVTSDDLVFLV